MDTITIQTPNGARIGIPAAVAFGAGGRPVDLIGDIEPEHCDHHGQTWSECFDLRCSRCGGRLFMPARFLANRTAEVLDAMHALWVRAGWPSFEDGQWPNDALWPLVQIPEFAHVGGLAVRQDRLDSFAAYLADEDPAP